MIVQRFLRAALRGGRHRENVTNDLERGIARAYFHCFARTGTANVAPVTGPRFGGTTSTTSTAVSPQRTTTASPLTPRMAPGSRSKRFHSETAARRILTIVPAISPRAAGAGENARIASTMRFAD